MKLWWKRFSNLNTRNSAKDHSDGTLILQRDEEEEEEKSSRNGEFLMHGKKV